MLSDLENLEKEKIKTYNTENDYFNQRLECAAPKRWSKYTTTKKTSFSYFMQVSQLFVILRQPVPISVTVFSNPTKLTNYLFILLIEI